MCAEESERGRQEEREREREGGRVESARAIDGERREGLENEQALERAEGGVCG